MKKLLILTVIGMLLAGLGGCRFMECLWRGPPCQQTRPRWSPAPPLARPTILAIRAAVRPS